MPYDRSRSKVYVGEYAAHDEKRRSTLRSALAEAAYMTGLERNGDVVWMASYAPLLSKVDHTNWNPDLIYFSNTRVFPTINYWVQRMFSRNAGDMALGLTVRGAGVEVSAVRDSESSDVIVKLVNTGGAARAVDLKLPAKFATAVKTVLAGDPDAVNGPAGQPVVPSSSTVSVGSSMAYEALPNSLKVLRFSRTR